MRIDKKKKLGYSANILQKTYTYHAYINMILTYYYENKEKVILTNLDLSEFITICNNSRIVCKNRGVIVEKVNLWNPFCYSYIYRTAKENDKLEIDIVKYCLAHPYANVNIFLSCEDGAADFIKDDNIIKIGLFNKNELFIKVNDEFVLSKSVNVETIKSLCVIKEQDKLHFFIGKSDNKKLKIYSMNLAKIFILKKTFLGVNVDTKEENYYNDLFLNNVQLISRYDAQGCLMIDYYSRVQRDYNYYTFDKYLDIQKYSLNCIVYDYNISLRKIISQSILSNKYVDIYVDMFFVYESKFFHKEHKKMELIVYSYEKRKKFGVVYLEEGNLRRGEIKWRDIKQSVCDDRLILLKHSVDLGSERIDIKSLMIQCTDYLNGTNSSINMYIVSGKHNANYGIKIYDDILNEDKNLDEIRTNPRLFRFLKEYSEMMKSRIDYLKSKKVIMGNYSNVLETMIEDATKMYEKVCQNSYASTISIAYIIDFINKRRDSEVNLFNRLIKELELYINNI